MKKIIVGLLVGLSAFSLVGCGSSSKYAATEDAAASYDYLYDDVGYAAEESVAMADEFEESANGGSANAETVGENATTSRKLITTVTLDAEATDYEECAANVRSKVAQYNGYIESESSGETRGDFTIRIPSKNLDAFLENLYDYTNVTYYTSSVEDVTLTYVDIEARISALRIEQERLEEFMSKAETVEDVIAIEERLSEVRYELQSYESQKRTYDNKIDYSTVILSISEVVNYTPPVKATIASRIKAGLSDNMLSFAETMADILVGIATVVPVIIVALIPIGIVFAIIFIPIYRSVKKQEAKRIAENEAKKAQEEKEDK